MLPNASENLNVIVEAHTRQIKGVERLHESNIDMKAILIVFVFLDRRNNMCWS